MTASTCVCPHCGNVATVIDDMGDRIVLYLDKFKPLPGDIREVKDPHRFTAEGLSETLGIPIAAVYRAKKGLMEQGMLDLTLRYRLTRDGKRVMLFSLTDRGHRYAAELRTFQERVREALP